MLSTNFVLATALVYVALLFVIAFYSDRRARRGNQSLIRSPLVYTLSISVYCTSWTFYGAVGSAARNGFEFATIYLGPTLVFIGWWFLLRKLVRIGRTHRITSIADLISSRYGKSTSLGILVTIIAVASTTPYIALQLKAVTTSFVVVSSPNGPSPNEAVAYDTAFWVAAAMAVFTILFGTRNIDANERNHGVVAAIAFEALVKLFAITAVGLFVIFSIGDGLGDLFSRPTTQALLQKDDAFGTRWIALTFLAACAIICLPRQFQVTVVENSDERHLRTASWMFPLYLFLMCLFILPIAVAGLAVLPAGNNPDMFVLTLPISRGQDELALLAFIGGFSSATSMVIVATIALSIMVSNHIIMPIALMLPRQRKSESADVKRLLLTSRRISIAAVLLLGFLYFRLTKSDALASIGLIAFTGVAQFVPSIIGGLFWRQATGRGAVAGLSAGFLIWIYCLFMPSFADTGSLRELVTNGPWGIEWLRPQALFGLEGMDPLVHALFWSLSINLILYIVVSIWKEAKPLERLQCALFVDVYRHSTEGAAHSLPRSATTDELYALALRILGRDAAIKLFRDFAEKQGQTDGAPRADAEFIAHLERELAGSIGAATAHAMVSQVAIGEAISLQDIMKVVDETQQVIVYSQQLERQSTELRETAAQLQRANEQLKLLDAQKDDFLSQVSHEVRTPMTSIRSFAELLLENNELPDDQRERFLKVIHSETLRLTRLLDEILDLSHLEQGEPNWKLQDIRAEETLARALETCQGLAGASKVAFRPEFQAPEANVSAVGDRLHQVFINLLSNAIKYNDNPSPVVKINSFVDDRSYHCTIQDNGKGIHPDARNDIFKKFARAGDRPSAPQGGTGLGLAISQKIVENLGGSLRLIDGDGDGACFRVTLPLAG